MEKIMLSEIASALGKTVDFDTEISDVCTDTRNLTEGCLFIAIKGERFEETIKRIGFENVEKQLFSDELLDKKEEILNQELATAK